MILLDTNVISAMMQSTPDSTLFGWLDRQSRVSLWTTSVTVLEIQRGIRILPAGKKRSWLESAFDRLIVERFDGRVVSFDAAAADKAAALIVSREQSGRNYDLEDGMIAGIAIAHHATVATRNVKHFDDLPIPVVNPWQA